MLNLLGINRYDPKDIAPRVIETLKNSQIIFGEHEDAAKEFMKMVGVDYSNKEVYEVNASNESKYARWAVEQVRLGKSISFLTGDGYPVITDPGYKLVNTFIQNAEEIRVYPQVSAIVSSVILSGYLGANNETFFYGGMLDFMDEKMKLEAMSSRDTIAVYLFQGTFPAIRNLEEIYGPERDVVICVNMGHDTQQVIHTKVGFLANGIPGKSIYATFVIAPINRESFFNMNKMPNNVLEYGNLKEIGIQQRTNYIHNSFNFRCDEFTQNHSEKLHVLFSGCSNTWPQAIDEDRGWAKQMYYSLDQSYNLSGYYNLGMPGSTISEICQNVMSYCKIFGKPKIIFLNLPDAGRESNIPESPNSKDEYTSFEKQQYADKEYEKLEGYCAVNNILLITFSWTDTMVKSGGYVLSNLKELLGKNHKNVSISNKFNTYKHFDKNDFKEYVVKYFEDNPEDHDADVARDADHPGHAIHWAWYNCLYEMFTKNTQYLSFIEGFKKVQESNQA
jgi:16S rRNA C1402 (ribose-2'-O) methylase RsmI